MTYQTKGNVLFLLKFEVISSTYFIFPIIFSPQKKFNITFSQVIFTKETVLFLVKNLLSPSISVGGRSDFLLSYTLL